MAHLIGQLNKTWADAARHKWVNQKLLCVKDGWCQGDVAASNTWDICWRDGVRYGVLVGWVATKLTEQGKHLKLKALRRLRLTGSTGSECFLGVTSHGPITPVECSLGCRD